MDRAIALLDRLFRGRRDTFGTFVPHEQYSGRRVTEPLTEDVWRAHIRGDAPIGVYPLVELDGEWVTSWVCIDIDQDTKPHAAHEIATAVAHASETQLAHPVPVYIETTKSRQAHLWMFFEEPTIAWKARAIAVLLLQIAGYKPYKKGKGDEIVIIPAHDKAPPKSEDGRGGTGNCVWCPWFGPHAKDERQVFFDWHTGAVYPDQLAAMENATLITSQLVEQLVDVHELKPANVKPIAAKPDDERYVPKAPAGSLPALTDVEFANLCAKLKPLRAMRETPTTCSYPDWFSGIMHLVPFADGHARTHQLSRLDTGRYDQGVTERQWNSAVALYSRDDAQPEARASQKIIEFWRAGGRPDITPISTYWAIWNGCFAKRKLSATGPEQDPAPISNFTAWVVCEEAVDDGSGTRERHVRMRGRMMTGAELPEIAVPTKDWTNVSVWLHKGWGFRPVMYGEPRHILQCIALCGQEAPEKQTYAHTGWTTVDGKPLFLTPHGPRSGATSPDVFEETSSVSVSDKLRVYDIPETVTPEQVAEAFRWIECFLDCGDLRATAPLMAAMFLAPLASFLNLDFALFLTGYTGTHKSSLVAAAMAVWGKRWSKDTLPASFISTANALELLAYQAKDMPLPIDNFVPDARGKSQEVLKRVSHSFGDHQGRDRASSEATLKSARPFRSLCIMTGEDVPSSAGAGATNRYYVIPMQRDTLKLLSLEAVQEAGWAGKMSPAMTHYLAYLTTKMVANPEWVQKVVAYHYQLEKQARREAAGREHDRLTSQTAWMRVGIELARQAHPNHEWTDFTLGPRIAEAFGAALSERRIISAEASLSHRFLAAMTYLSQSGVVHGMVLNRAGHSDPRREYIPTDPMHMQLLGWAQIGGVVERVRAQSRPGLWIDLDTDRPTLCFRPMEILTEIRNAIRTDSPIVEGLRGIAQALLSDGILCKSRDADHLSHSVSLEGGRRAKMWRLDLAKTFTTLGWTIDSAPPSSGGSASPDPAQ